jgi:hypothetical protein
MRCEECQQNILERQSFDKWETNDLAFRVGILT